MKLYTEEQVREAFEMGHAHGTNWIHPNLYHSMKKLTPIELPSDEEIHESSPIVHINADDYHHGAKRGFKDGAKWLKQHILNQNK